jgi:hypothetical protein
LNRIRSAKGSRCSAKTHRLPDSTLWARRQLSPALPNLARCKIEGSLCALGSRHTTFAPTLTTIFLDALIESLATGEDRASLIDGLYVFTRGGVRLAAGWLYAHGRVQLTLNRWGSDPNCRPRRHHRLTTPAQPEHRISTNAVTRRLRVPALRVIALGRLRQQVGISQEYDQKSKAGSALMNRVYDERVFHVWKEWSRSEYGPFVIRTARYPISGRECEHRPGVRFNPSTQLSGIAVRLGPNTLEVPMIMISRSLDGKD